MVHRLVDLLSPDRSTVSHLSEALPVVASTRPDRRAHTQMSSPSTAPAYKPSMDGTTVAGGVQGNGKSPMNDDDLHRYVTEDQPRERPMMKMGAPPNQSLLVRVVSSTCLTCR